MDSTKSQNNPKNYDQLNKHLTFWSKHNDQMEFKNKKESNYNQSSVTQNDKQCLIKKSCPR